jgi:hypothetical protein
VREHSGGGSESDILEFLFPKGAAKARNIPKCRAGYSLSARALRQPCQEGLGVGPVEWQWAPFLCKIPERAKKGLAVGTQTVRTRF